MKLSRLKELRPDVWEEAKMETIRENGKVFWDMAKAHDFHFFICFTFKNTSNEEMWAWLHLGKTTLLKEWEAKQTA